MSQEEIFLELAGFIDNSRAESLRGEYAGPARALCTFLGTCYPAMAPTNDWQVEALEQIAAEGWRVQRRQDDLRIRFEASARGAGSAEAGMVRRRRWFWAEKARIALREALPQVMGGATIDVSSRELSDLADASCDFALAEAAREAAERYGPPVRADGELSGVVALGLGKLGGHELNAGSDIDLIFVYDTDEGASSVDLHAHWTRVIRRAVALLEEPTPEGKLWRVDLRLRPEGSQGPIVNSIAAAERYYETWGRMWERAALLRSRPIAGDFRVGETLARDIVDPFVFHHRVDPSIATALVELVQRSRAELSRDHDRDLKLGPGGIREAEFFVQSLQLIWGGQEPSLRVQSTLQALARLRSLGLVTDREAQDISDAYVLLRRAEHVVQWSTGVQTHLLPADKGDLERMARVLGMTSAAELTAELEQARSVVSERFAGLAPEAPRPPPRYQPLLAMLDDAAPALPEAAEELFGSAEVGEHLHALAQRPDGLLGSLTRDRYPEFADQVLDAVSESPDIEQAARYLRLFFGRFTATSPYTTALATDPRRARQLAWVLGASAFVAESILNRPELADIVLFGTAGRADPSAAVKSEIEQALRRLKLGADAYERRNAMLSGLRKAKLRVTVEVAVSDLAGSVETREATRLLSDLAEEQLCRTVDFVMEGNTAGFSVIGVGKLGGREIGYGSDLDVIFIYDPDAAPPNSDAGEFFAKRAQKIIRMLSEPHPGGAGYELDTRLRPSGSHGMLVTSLGSFARYHGIAMDLARKESPAVLSSGAPWERQALLRARPVAGDMRLGERVAELAAIAAYERGAPPVREMHRMRMRMQRELAKERPGRYDLKTGSGGLLDIEFAVQWLQMTNGADARVRTTDTREALEALMSAGYLERWAYETLREGYGFLRRLEQRIHVLRGWGSTVMEIARPGLRQLARRMGFLDGADATATDLLLSRYRDLTGAVRRTYLSVLGLQELEP